MRHQSKDQLDKLKDMTVLFDCKLSSPLLLDVGSSRYNMLADKPKFPSKTIYPGAREPVYISALSDEK